MSEIEDALFEAGPDALDIGESETTETTRLWIVGDEGMTTVDVEGSPWFNPDAANYRITATYLVERIAK